MKIDLKAIDKFIQIEKERQLASQEVSQALGIDISFSDEEVMRNALEAFEKHLDKQVSKEVETWMKSLFS
jgi:hypothetical protein